MSKPGAIITGAASGIGLALTKHLHEKQWKVVMMDINVAGEDIAKELGSDVLWLRCDVTNWEGLVEGFDRAFRWCPTISFLAANAGITTDLSAPHGILSANLEGLQKPSFKVLDVNLIGTISCIKIFLYFMQQKSQSTTVNNDKVQGRIVITGSEGGLFKLDADPIYCASKHALVGLARSLGQTYLNNYGITVNSINPGYVPTPLVAPLISITPIENATPMTTMIRGFDQLMESERSGQILEASGENLYLRPQYPYLDDISKWVWEDAPGFWIDALTQMGKQG